MDAGAVGHGRPLQAAQRGPGEGQGTQHTGKRIDFFSHAEHEMSSK